MAECIVDEETLAAFKSNAGFVGKSKLARSVGTAALSELEVRQAETRGGERMMNASKATFQRVDDVLVINYKVGRSKRCESVPFQDIALVLDDLKQQLAGDSITGLEIAIHYADHFWLLRYHGKKIDDALDEIGASLKRGRK
jgi:hypothetical protein